jgi:hypothetical protein
MAEGRRRFEETWMPSVFKLKIVVLLHMSAIGERMGSLHHIFASRRSSKPRKKLAAWAPYDRLSNE